MRKLDYHVIMEKANATFTALCKKEGRAYGNTEIVSLQVKAVVSAIIDELNEKLMELDRKIEGY